MEFYSEDFLNFFNSVDDIGIVNDENVGDEKEDDGEKETRDHSLLDIGEEETLPRPSVHPLQELNMSSRDKKNVRNRKHRLAKREKELNLYQELKRLRAEVHRLKVKCGELI